MQTATRRAKEQLAPYLAAVRGLRQLSREEEHRLAVEARAGDPAAREALVRHSLGMVVALARKAGLGVLRLEDVIQEGNVGLIRALESFDPDRGTRFSTYAIWWIRAYIGKYLKEARSSVRPRSGTNAVADLSLDSRIDDDDDTTHLDRVADPGPGPEDEYLAHENRKGVQDALSVYRKRLGELGWDIIQTRIRVDAPHTLEQVGRRWGLSRERVRQVELRTKRLLASLLEESHRPAA